MENSSSDPHHETLKIDRSMTPPPHFNNEPVTFDPRFNLLKNPRAEDGLQGWWIVENGGDGWLTGTSTKPHPDDTVTNCFITSYCLSLKRQLIDLKKEGYSNTFMDRQPHIKISDWCAPRTEHGSEYQICVELLDQMRNPIRTFKPEKVVFQKGNDVLWRQITHVFKDYGPGVRFIRFTHGGRDIKFWKGWFGIQVTNSSVEICPPAESVDHGGELETTAQIHDCVSSNTHTEEPQRCDVPQDLCGESLTGLNWEAEWSGAAHGGEFRSSSELHKYACDLTLDPNTANTQLILSEENRKVTPVFQDQSYPDHPERFENNKQVLCGESLTGRCYWEAEWSGTVRIAVAYRGISRKGWSDCVFGQNDKSWSLNSCKNKITVCHNKRYTVIHVPSLLSNRGGVNAVRSFSKRVGVYVDVSAGTLSFYSVSDTHTLTHLHTINTTFTKSLYAGFGVYECNSSVSLCDIKQPPVRNNSDTHTTGISDSKPSGLNFHPLLNCQSCVHIADSDQWVQIEPSACTDKGGSKFRVSTDPGRYECVRTRMRWVCEYDVTLQYCTVDGHFLNTELERLQCDRIAPVIDVTVISGKLEEVHLPHYACLGESDPSLKDAVKVLSVKDEGITTEPVQLTRFHAKIVQPSFSLKTLIISWIMRVDEHCDLLLYMCSKVPLILHVYFFPVDDCAKEKVEKNEKSSYPIMHPRPDRPFRMKTPHILDVPGALTIHPKEGITLRRETDPNYFKVKTRLENDFEMTLIREEDQKTVWTAIIEKDELDLLNPKGSEQRLTSEAGKVNLFDKRFPDLIQGVKNVQIIADKLHQQNLIHEEQYSEINHESLTSQDSMIIRKHRDAVKAKFISIF